MGLREIWAVPSDPAFTNEKRKQQARTYIGTDSRRRAVELWPAKHDLSLKKGDLEFTTNAESQEQWNKGIEKLSFNDKGNTISTLSDEQKTELQKIYETHQNHQSRQGKAGVKMITTWFWGWLTSPAGIEKLKKCGTFALPK